MKNVTSLFINCSLFLLSAPIYGQNIPAPLKRIEAEKYHNHKVSLKIEDNNLSNNLGIKKLGNDTEEPTLVVDIDVQNSGLYILETFAVNDDYGAALMAKAKTKFESLFLEIQINDQPKTKRVVSVPWNIPKQELGKFSLSEKNKIKIWLPKGVVLDYIDLIPYKEPEVPEVVKNYNPKIIPNGHPRLWVDTNSLVDIKKNLNNAENKDRWEKVQKLALQTIEKPIYSGEVNFDEALEKAIEAKAFYYLVTHDKKIGNEAIDLTKMYIEHVSFGNLLDITREIGRAIHITSEVYDWCYDLLNEADKKSILKNLKRLAIDMEIGWPPFLQPVVNGHGAEAQIHRDLLSMAIAIYDEDPIPYQYCAYRVLEELIPMRKFEYQSPRHNQGINYGAYRMNWDLHAAWLFKRMSGKDIFDENIKNTADYWLYFRLPDGQMLRDGDHALRSAAGVYDYWQINPTFTFMHYSYSRNPYLKHSFEKMNSSSINPVLFLLLNDPTFKSAQIPKNYPLSKDFGPILGGMVNRTGWDDSIKSNNVVAEIKGGGYFFSNHQHNDVGALQVYYRGFQVADLGQYKFYGTPYDLNFTKRSVSHSVMLAVDTLEKIGNIPSNDGGTRMFRKVPNSPKELIENSNYLNGKVLSSSPSDKFSYFAMDLTSAYSDKMKYYQREYIFVNTQNETIPAIIILKDQMKTANPSIKKYWQVNTINKPTIDSNGQIHLNSSRDSLFAYTHINFVYPSMKDLESTILAKEDAHNIFGYQVSAPDLGQFESNGHRVLMSPKKAQQHDNFLTIFQLTNSEKSKLAYSYQKINGFDQINILNMLILIKDGSTPFKGNINIQIKEQTNEVYVVGLEKGSWKIVNKKGKVVQNITVDDNKNTAMFVLSKGKYSILK